MPKHLRQKGRTRTSQILWYTQYSMQYYIKWFFSRMAFKYISHLPTHHHPCLIIITQNVIYRILAFCNIYSGIYYYDCPLSRGFWIIILILSLSISLLSIYTLPEIITIIIIITSFTLFTNIFYYTSSYTLKLLQIITKFTGTLCYLSLSKYIYMCVCVT